MTNRKLNVVNVMLKHSISLTKISDMMNEMIRDLEDILSDRKNVGMKPEHLDQLLQHRGHCGVIRSRLRALGVETKQKET